MKTFLLKRHRHLASSWDCPVVTMCPKPSVIIPTQPFRSQLPKVTYLNAHHLQLGMQNWSCQLQLRSHTQLSTYILTYTYIYIYTLFHIYIYYHHILCIYIKTWNFCSQSLFKMQARFMLLLIPWIRILLYLGAVCCNAADSIPGT